MVSKLNILIVEDSESDALLLIRDLKKKNVPFEHGRAESADELRSALAEKDWDIVLSDYSMPQFTGLDVIRIARESDEDLPVIVISGTIGEDVAVDAMRAGATDYLMKDNLERLVPALEREVRDARHRRVARQTKCQLAESNRKWKTTFDALHSPILLLTPEQRISECNAAALTLLGHDTNDVMGRHCWEVVHGMDKPIDNCPFLRSKESGVRENMTLDLGDRTFEVATDPIFESGNGRVFHGAVHIFADMTELIQSEKRFRNFFENEPSYCFMVSPEGKIIDVNQSALTALGYEEKELIGRPLSLVYAPESQAQMKENFREWKEKGSLLNKEMTVLTKGGEPRTVLLNASAIKDTSGRFLNSVSVQTDITDLRKARVEAQAQEELLRQIAANFPHSYVSIIEKDLTVGFTSGQEFTNQGMNPDDFVGLTLDEVFGEHTPAVKEHYLKTFEGEETSFELFINNQYQLYKTVPLSAKDGRVDRILAVVENITERKEAEKKLKESEEQLSQSQKMEGIGRLAGGIAHDFNNLMTVVTGYSELIREKLKAGGTAFAEIDEVAKAGKRATDLTRQLLAFSRKQVLKPEIVDLNKVVSGFERMLQRIIGEDIDLVFRPQRDLNMVEIDKGQIEQVIMNLAVNARDAMPKGGKLTLETLNVELDESYASSHPEVEPGPHVMLAVSDTGTGMTEDTRKRLFEPFFTTKEPGKGTGLGLSTVYGIVKQSGGSIWVYSEPGKGTAFKIYFPMAVGSEKSDRPSREIRRLSRGSETLLIVEDDAAVLAVVNAMLEGSGYTILEAAHGEEALRICEAHKGNIDLLLTDVVMPGMGGRELAECVLEKNPDMRVLYMSGYTGNAIQHHGVLDPNTAFIEKPFSPTTLTRKIREVLDGVEGE